MPKESTGESTEGRSYGTSDVHWDRIGINAVAAASICKSYDQHRHEQDTVRIGFPLAEAEFATD